MKKMNYITDLARGILSEGFDFINIRLRNHYVLKLSLELKLAIDKKKCIEIYNKNLISKFYKILNKIYDDDRSVSSFIDVFVDLATNNKNNIIINYPHLPKVSINEDDELILDYNLIINDKVNYDEGTISDYELLETITFNFIFFKFYYDVKDIQDDEMRSSKIVDLANQYFFIEDVDGNFKLDFNNKYIKRYLESIALIILIGHTNKMLLDSNQDFDKLMYYKGNINDKLNLLKNDNELFSYNWNFKKSGDIKTIYNNLEPHLYDTSLKEFKEVFNNKKVSDIKAIKTRLEASELIYLLLQLMEYNFIDKEKNLSQKRLRACFKKADGSDYNENLSTLKNQITKNENLSSEKRKKINDIIKY